jgi:Domain of unknown function (DUF4032)/Lipopolysaccharide kinase (Kdo/WaaP) family
VSTTFSLLARTGHPDFLDLPWDQPLRDWESERIVDVARGIHRHVVRFVDYDGRVYALKELPGSLADREYRLLRRLAEEHLPVVEAAGTVTGRTTAGGRPLDSVLITRHLSFSLPYRYLFVGRTVPDVQAKLLDALALLLVRVHLEGFFWGDCSLSNALFRRDAGALYAYLVDAETGEFHPTLSRGQREHDLEIATGNVAGELLDLVAAGRLPEDTDPARIADDLRRRYDGLWSDLTREEVFNRGERYRVDARLRRLNELGFDVEEFELVATDGGDRIRVQPRVVEEGHHSRRLRQLTGLGVQENQARRLLNDMAGYRAHLERAAGRELPDAVAAYRWLTEVFQPTIDAIPEEHRHKLEPAEAFHEILEHRWLLSERAGKDVGNAEAVASYVAEILATSPSEAWLLGRTWDTGAVPVVRPD